MEELISKVNDSYQKGREAKEIARKSDGHLDMYITASEFYLEAVSFLESIIQNLEPSKINGLTRSTALKEYYLFESFECRYAFEYKTLNFSEAIKFAKEAKTHIDNTLRIIEDNFLKLSDDAKAFLTEMKENWALCQLTIKVRIIEPTAKSALENEDFVSAMDFYREMDRLHDDIFQYVNSSNLAEVYKRIENGNYHASKASIANTIAGIYIQKNHGNYFLDILEQFLISIDNIKKAQDINPEWDRYKEGLNKMKKNVVKILKENPDKWDTFYYNFEGNNNLKILMKETDVKKFNELEFKRRLNDPDNKAKKLLIYGGFWVSVFLIIFGSITSLFLLKISWIYIILIILLVQFMYALIAATVLRNLGDLSEKGFLEIYRLTMRLNFNLFNKNKSKT